MIWSIMRAKRRILRRSSEGRLKKGKGWLGEGRGVVVMSAEAWESEVIDVSGVLRLCLRMNGLLIIEIVHVIFAGRAGMLARIVFNRFYIDLPCKGYRKCVSRGHI